ncbi:magnesium chelatase subunit D family protein [Hymenobacter sp. BT559]|uniref:magnesium chelatase subunit D family protein n=1 Tax=Hymenobacter sp. BT559 TaxID=2795729 RepID=UPI0018EB7BD7|nr:magnesium chelatase subunit D family protein [Hymenobacter sp. BT559]MBJ6146442.1 magnesium chelatase subunit D family protein [Hymenobacter sp. BT559]
MNYPFAALVGQDMLKQALLLCAVNPTLGGVLLRGDKGTAKTTAVRGLADVLPPILAVPGCPFNCEPGQPADLCPVCHQPDAVARELPAPFVNFPLGATEDRVLGSLDLEGLLADRQKKLQPGLLAAAHRGVLYIDEVNLLPDHLVDVLLDAAATGVSTVQREGLAVSHPARFALIGTMNPEEGNLRPQFLDRFGLMVDISAPRDVAERTEVVRRRIAFERDPAAFQTQWQPAQAAIRQQLIAAQLLLPAVQMPEGLLTLISQLCTELGVASLRADIVLYKTALTLAALEGRTTVTAADVRRAAELALAHRRRAQPFDSPSLPSQTLDELMQQAPLPTPDTAPQPPTPPSNSAQPSEEPSSAADNAAPEEDNTPLGAPQEASPEQVFTVGPTAPTRPIVVEAAPPDAPLVGLATGQRGASVPAARGQYMRAVLDRAPSELAIEATVRQAVLRDPAAAQITRDDLHQKVRSSKTGTFLLLVVDASGSMSASRRMEAVKGAVLSLLTEAYQQRDTVAVIAFRGVEARVLLPPTRSVAVAEEALRTLPTGGRTPLPHALQLAAQLLARADYPTDLQPLLVLLSDGKANVPLAGGGDAGQQTQQLAEQLRTQNIPTLVLDTDTSYLRLGKAAELATALGAQYLPLDELSATSLTNTILTVNNQMLARV